MIRKLKLKFIILAMTALLVLLAVIITGMNLINYASVVREADTVLSILSQNKGIFPDFGGGPGNRLPPEMSPETPYESRYFSVFLDKDGNVINTETSMIVLVDAEEAVQYAETVIKNGEFRGFVDEYRYVFKNENNGSRIIFLDCGRRLESFHDFLFASIAMAVCGFVAVFAVVFILSGRIIRPIAESYEKQKRFITDAGHEIKTPLTIINANVDILGMEIGENESLEDITQQTKRLRSLTDELVMLARMEEAEDKIQKIEFPVSEVVSDSVNQFRVLAMQQGKEFVCNIQPMLTLKGNNKSIEKLVDILLDNAFKYSPVGGTVSLDMVKQTRVISLTVSNTTENEISQEQLSHVFDRFYRTDASRNSETGGHGIGLSVAHAIVMSHGGKIQASLKDGGHLFQINALFPIG